MKISLALKPRRDLSRSEARGCLIANLLLPGSGSLVAGRAIGYLQLAIALIAMGLTLVAGMGFIVWALKNWKRLREPQMDPFANFYDLWMAVRWPLLGIALFVVAILFALITSFEIMRGSKPEGGALPPRLR